MRAAVLLLAAFPVLAVAGPYTLVAGNIRIQVVSNHLIRLEQKGPMGFEDRKSFTVVNRDYGTPKVKVRRQADATILESDAFTIFTPDKALTLRDVLIYDAYNQLIYQNDGKLPATSYLPAPGYMKPAWVMADSPRLIPPAWGATPASKSVESALAAKSGWDDRNDSPDLYVFVPGQLGYAQLREDFINLTGPVPKPPLSILGFIDSRYYPYSEKEALDVMDTYRKKGIPLDTFVVDTDWRINGSSGYSIEPKYFPDMGRFIKESHKRNVRLMFNDHPDPKAATALDPKELTYRSEGLSKLLDLGLDYWWYDRNWTTALKEPMPGIRREVWGQRLYHDITERAHPNLRPWIMTNAEGIDNGVEHYPPHPAGHRYPMMWTGDTGSDFSFLKHGVESDVDRGILALQPYTHEDLGGHLGPTPSPELYVRYLQYGCLSPIARIHCTLGQDRHPWAFGADAEQIVTDMIKLRYRLLPTLYSAAQHATDDGTPILRRCDLYWPMFAEAAHDDQYLLGDDLLVAPILTSVKGEPISMPEGLFRTPLGLSGIQAEYFTNDKLELPATVMQVEKSINCDWGAERPMPSITKDNFSVRWSSLVGPMPKSGEYRVVTQSHGGVRVTIDGKLVIDDWTGSNSTSNSALIHFDEGSTHTFKVEYRKLSGEASCKLGWILPGDSDAPVSKRTVWIPPGTWQNLWTGETVTGPKTLNVSAKLSEIPMWVVQGGLVLTGPDLQYTSQKPMDPITVDCYVGPEVATKRELVEDDGMSNAYLKGSVARTEIEFGRQGNYAGIRAGATKGSFDGQKLERNWIVRVHLPKGTAANSVRLDNKLIQFGTDPKQVIRIPFNRVAAPGEGDVITINLPTTSIRKEHTVIVELK